MIVTLYFFQLPFLVPGGLVAYEQAAQSTQGLRRHPLPLLVFYPCFANKLVCRNHRYSGMYSAKAHNIIFNRYRCVVHIYLDISGVRVSAAKFAEPYQVNRHLELFGYRASVQLAELWLWANFSKSRRFRHFGLKHRSTAWRL